MTQQAPKVETSLQIRKTISAPRDLVYRAWTEPDMLQRWWGVEASFSAPIAEVDLKVGGSYRLAMKPPDKDEMYIVGGVFREVIPAEKLVYTWKWEGIEDAAESLVTVEFVDQGTGTELILTHENFSDTNMRNEHNHGWEGCLTQLATLLEAA